jgi:hypothetical protein
MLVKLKKQIKSLLIELQKPLELDDSVKLLNSTNLFDWLKFRIVGGYVEISNTNNSDDFRVITQELVPNLTQLDFQYSKPIDYNKLSTIVILFK